VEIFHSLKLVLKKNHYATSVGDEGGFAPSVPTHREALALIMDGIEAAGYHAGRDVLLALDAAASGFYQGGKYHLKCEPKPFSSDDMVAYYEHLCDDFPIVSIEDGLSETDWKGWHRLTKKLGDRVQLVGDDIFVTNEALIIKGIEEGIGNAILIKPNQIGTLSETLRTIERAKQSGYRTILSHRSGETEDVTIADLAVGVSAGQIKTGAPCRSDRTAKYNALLRIEANLKGAAIFRSPFGMR